MPFDIGFIELCVVIIVALLVLGPERLPVAARTLGRWIGKAQRAFVSVKSEINRELQLDELRQQLKQQQQQMEQLLNQQELSDLQQQIEETRLAFRKEMQQQHNEPNNPTDQVRSSSGGASTIDPSMQNQQLNEKRSPDAGEESDEALSGCKNPVEFEPLPRNDKTQENTIHPKTPNPQPADPQPTDPKSGC